MSVYAAESSRGKPIWISDNYVNHRQLRKQYKRDPSVDASCDPGYNAAVLHDASVRDEYSLASLTVRERVQLIVLYRDMQKDGIALSEARRRIFDDDAARAQMFVRKVVDECLESKKKRLNMGISERYLKQLTHVLGKFSESFGDLRIAAVTSQQIEAWLQSGKYADSSRRSRRNDIGTLFSFASRRRYVERNPCNELEPVAVRRKTPGILSLRQASKLMRGAYWRDRELCPWLALALFEGVRICELERISGAQIKQEGLLLDLEWQHVKGGGKSRRVRLHDNTRAWLELEGQIPPKNLKRRFERLRRQLGMFKTWPRNAMRHSAASYLFALTEDAGRTTKHLGQTETVFHSNYHSPVLKEDAESFYKILPPQTNSSE